MSMICIEDTVYNNFIIQKTDSRKKWKFYCDYPEGFETEDLYQVIKIVTDKNQEDPMKVLRIVYPQYHIQVTFCEDEDIIVHIMSKGKDDLVKHLKCIAS